MTSTPTGHLEAGTCKKGKYQDRKLDEVNPRSFGLLMGVVFLLTALRPLWSGAPVRIWAVIISGGFFLLTIAKSPLLLRLASWWKKLGLFLHRIVSPIALMIVFYLVVTPVGLVMRLFKGDFLNLKINRSAGSYWVDKTAVVRGSMENQF